MFIDDSLFDRLGGKPTFIRVHKIFYDKAFAHPWLGKYMEGHDQDLLENQQTDFMVQLMGGPKIYAGKTPKTAHRHMMITEELFDLRSRLLSESIQEAGISDDLRDQWLAVDSRLKQSLVKQSEAECSRRYFDEPIVNFPK